MKYSNNLQTIKDYRFKNILVLPIYEIKQPIYTITTLATQEDSFTHRNKSLVKNIIL